MSWRDLIRTASGPSSPARALSPWSWRALAQSASLLLPAWWVWNPGQGGGGSGTVHVDGTTIEGDGSAGNPLHVVPTEFFTTSYYDAGSPNAPNLVLLWGFEVQNPVTFSNISVIVGQADPNPNNYDIGIYNFAGTLLANIGAQVIPVADTITLPILQGTITIPQGLYMFGVTGTDSGLVLGGNSLTFAWMFDFATVPSVGGALPATVPPFAISPAHFTQVMALSA